MVTYVTLLSIILYYIIIYTRSNTCVQCIGILATEASGSRMFVITNKMETTRNYNMLHPLLLVTYVRHTPT